MPQVIQQNKVSVFANATSSLLLKAIKTIGTSIYEFFKQISLANSRTAEIERMNLLTDYELAQFYGINRDQIVAYVFRDKMF